MYRLFCIVALVISFMACKKNNRDELLQNNSSAFRDKPGTENLAPAPTPAYDWTAMPVPITDPPGDPDGHNIIMPVNGVVYCIKGFSFTKTLYKLNNTTKRWAPSDDFEFDPLSQYLFSYQSKLYFGMSVANHTVYNNLHSIDATTGVKTTLAIFPGTAVVGAASFVIGDKGYIVSGLNLASNTVNQLWEYSFSANQWTNKGGSPVGARSGATAFVIDNKAYIGLGYDYITLNGQKIKQYKNDWILYNPSSVYFGIMTPFPGQKRSNAEGFVLNNSPYVGFGSNSSSSFDDFWKYNPSSNTWTQQASWPGVLTERNIFGGFSQGNTGYVVKGDLAEFWRYSNSPFTP